MDLISRQFVAEIEGFLEETREEDHGYIPDFIQKQLGWRKIAVLMHGHDVNNSLVSGISQSSLHCLVYDLNITDTADALHAIHQILFPAVNVVAIMKQDHLLQLMTTSNTFIYKYVFNGTNHYEGYAMEIFDTITEVLNLSYSITEPKDRSWGLPVNGTYDGIVGELFRREVDLAVSDLIINEDRVRFMDYIYPPIRTEYHDVLYKRHEPQEYASLFLLVRPFQPLLYLVILSAACAMPFLVAMIESHPSQYPDVQNTTLIRGYFTKFKLNLYTYSWDVLKSLARQGFSTHPRTMSGKVLVTSWWLLVLVLTSVYCGNLVAALSAHADSPLFSSLEELLDSDYSVGMDGNSISNTVLEASSNTSVQGRLWAKITNNDPSFLKSDAANHIRRIKQQKYALLLFKSSAESYSAEDCQLEPLGAEQLWIHLAFGIQKNSPLKDDIQRMMSYLSQSGILEMLWKKWHQQMGETKCVSNRSTMTGISLEQIGGGFILAGVGLVLSTIVLSLEKLKAYKSRLCE
ncbi:glutamate receptor ionotropic, kainate 5-like [Haliotis rufescens]|uniref:glutamate receptor ionotropic, kainate 5-like n=1 Tax=Haliotis rufescens TaxID=6454 RepID=UPI00201F82D0|nr:glutamate receptor ionotropic, kainate 5-like [Haliotis rufescens]